MFNLSVEEAATRLGVSVGRIYQLIKANALVAEKTSGVWFVDEGSVAARLIAKPTPGRPSKHKPRSEALRVFTLMNASYPLLTFAYDTSTGEFVDAYDIVDASRAPLGLLSPRGKIASKEALAFWWRHRAIPESREGLDAVLSKGGLRHSFEIPFKSLGLSLTDQYWIAPKNESIEWSAVNYFDNPTKADIPHISTNKSEIRNSILTSTPASWLANVGLNSPDNTSEGELPKRWIWDGKHFILLKGGGVLNQEPFNEVVATALYKRLFDEDEYTSYSLYEDGGHVVCACPDFITRASEYIPAYYVNKLSKQANHHSDYQHYIECCSKLGVPDTEQRLSKMIVSDDILANTDRHLRNFGLIRNVETLEYTTAPLFDTGASLWFNTPIDVLERGDFTYCTKPFYEDAKRQLLLVNDYSWLDFDALEGFVDEVGDILSGNAELKDRISLICSGIEYRIERLKWMLK